MKRVKLYIRAFFGFSRMETNGFLLLMPLTLVILFSEPIYRLCKSPEPVMVIDRTDSLLAWMANHEVVSLINRLDTIRFYSFNPNKISPDSLVALGLGDRIATRIEKYRAKGGQFRKKEDLARIFGMDSLWYQRASPWMKFPKAGKILAQLPRKQRLMLQDINLADTLQLQDVYGIGPALARRIVTFRDRLGGFLTMEQLKEVYGLDSIVVSRVKRQFEVKLNFIPRLINVQTASMDDLIRHPYISRRQASAIVAYRSQRHRIDSIGQLLQVKIVDESWLAKVRPYLVIPGY